MLYEFKCRGCGVITEDIVKMGAKEIKCPECGTVAYKIMSVVNFNVKGFNAKNSYSHERKGKKKNV